MSHWAVPVYTSGLVDAAILGGGALRKGAVVDDVLQFSLQPVVQVGTGNALRDLAHHGIFIGKRHIAKVVDGVVVAEGTEGAGLGNPLLLLRHSQVGSLGHV